MVIDLRFHTERPSAPKPRKSISFLEKLNMRHGSLTLHMRSKRGEETMRGHEQHQEHSRTPSLPDEVLSASPETMTSQAERSLSELNLRHHELEDEQSPTLPHTWQRARQDSGVSLSIPHAVSQNDWEWSPDFAHDMQNFKLRHQPSFDSSLVALARLSLASSRKSSSRGPSSEMSDEQIDEWLEKPVDAEVHRYRKLSAGSANSKMIETDCKEG